jgi:uncharacterized protein involved in response to NO
MTTEPETAPRRRRYEGPAVLAHGFRPFFFLAGLWAVAALPLSFAAVQGWIAPPTALAAVSWHYHEMLFGYAAASVAGFLLTAVPNWTGGLPLRGGPLLGLAALWVLGRLAVATSGWIGPWVAALADLLFLAALAAVVLREIVVGRNWRNGPVGAAVVLLLLCNALFHAEALGLAALDGLSARGGIAVIVVLLSLIGGRIVPSFTRNWLARRGDERLPAPLGRFDQISLLTAILALASWIAVPSGSVTGVLAALAAALNLVRLLRWRGLATLAEPLVWVLHVGYLWLPLGLALLAVSIWWPVLPQSGAVHALTTGAVGTMTLAVMSRATLGHTGRALTAGPGLTAAYALVSLTTVARVAAPLSGDIADVLLGTAAVAWTGAFLLFLAICGPMLVTRRSSVVEPH